MRTEPRGTEDTTRLNQPNIPAAEPKPTRWFKLKMFGIAEALLVAIALVMPITPSKTGRPFEWPATWDEYFDRFLLDLVIGHGALALIIVFGWIYWKWSKTRKSDSNAQ